jgi:hypothetical protein
MKKAIFFVTLSIILLAAAQLAARYRITHSVERTQARGVLVFDVKLTSGEWMIVEYVLSGLGLFTFVAATPAYLQRKRIN